MTTLDADSTLVDPDDSADPPAIVSPPDAGTVASLIYSGLVMGMGPTFADGITPVTAGAESAVLVLGPSRSGKTSAIVIPTILSAPGAVVSTSTKGDVLDATVSWRSQMGRCFVFDPSGTVVLPPGASELRWSPVTGCTDWDAACEMAHALVTAARPGSERSEAAHWTERADALLSPLLHAAALAGLTIDDVCRWVLSQDVRQPEAILTAAGGGMAKITLSGIWKTEERERSGIFSTASGILSPYRSDRVREAACNPNFDLDAFVASYDTVYICAPATAQDRLAPLVVALLEQLRTAVYAHRATNPDAAPVVFALDEAANIAALPSLPQIASEGGGQGLLLLACIQDLSQARARWGTIADGFFSLFPVKVIFPGVADAKTLELISQLGGEILYPMVSVNRPDRSAAWSGKGFVSHTHSFTWRRRLPVDAIANASRGTALCLVSGRPIEWVMTVPWDQVPQWSRCAEDQDHPAP